MPSVRRIPEDKRRSRMGCLQCRKRRRKCDEKKPQCANCLARNVPCAYKDWTFVPVGTPVRATPVRADRVGAHRVVAGDNHDDDDDDGAVVINTPGSSAGTLRESSQHCTPRSVDVPYAQHAGSDAVATPTPSTAFRADSRPADEDDASQLAVILSHFQYRVASWMDGVAPRSTFAMDLLALAHDGHPALLDSIAELVARHDGSLAEHVAVWRLRRQRHQRRLPQYAGAADADRIAAVTNALVSLYGFFGAPVATWRAAVDSFAVPASQRDARGLLCMAQPLQTLVRLHCKIDLGSALLRQSAPQLGLPITTASVTAPDGSGLAPLEFADACLAQLADGLALCARDAPAQSPQAWLLLWTRCLRWYETRPPAMAPISASGRLGESVAEALAAPFPTEVYTSVLAVQASIALHAALALLLANKPGGQQLLQAPVQQSRRLASQRWHAQTIAAIAGSNHFPEQSDPVVVAALLWVARDMTHPLQQQALVDMLAVAGRAGGTDLREALAQLQEHWRSFRG